MSARNVRWQRGMLVIALLVVAAAGTANFGLRRQVPFRAARDGHRLEISSLKPGSGAERQGIQDGDELLAIDGRPIHHLHEASWALGSIPRYGHAELDLARGDSLFTVTVTADQATAPLFLLLDRMTGLAFLILGLLVWWHGRGDPTVAAFLRVNVIIGAAVMMNDFPSVFATKEMQAGFAAFYLSVRSLIPAALVDFLFRFTASSSSALTGRAIRRAFWATGLLVAAAISITIVMARLTASPEWILRFDVTNRHVYGSWLILGMVLAVGRLVYAARRAEKPWHRRQLRWLLLCLVIGATPYVALEKLPTLWGWSPLIVPDLAMAMLLITPIGWAMAVASFHMMRVQWTLSRTFVYVVTAGITVYAIGGAVTLGSALLHRDLLTPMTVLFLALVVVIVLVSRALVDRVRWAVDRAYYGDWFDYRRVVRDLEIRLSNSLREQDIVPALTDEIASVLKVDGCALVVRGGVGAPQADGEWSVLSPAGAEPAGSWMTLLPSERESELVELHPSMVDGEFVLAVPLLHAEMTRGWLFLGRKTSGAPFSEHDYQLLNSLSPVIGMALANVELNRRLLDQARRLVVIELAGGIAHEIGNALSPLMGQAQLLKYALKRNGDSLAREDVAPPLKIITDMSARIRRIVQNLSRLSEPVLLAKSTVCLNEIADEAIQLMSETAGRIKRFHPDDDGAEPDMPYRLHREFCADMPVIRADRQQLSQVFINLFINAADAMEPMGQGVLTVGTSVSIDPPGVIGYVQDTGPGVPPGLADKLFLPYFTTKPQGKGTGLGLSFVRSIVDAHRGWINLRSPAEGGTRVEFFLPATFGNGQIES